MKSKIVAKAGALLAVTMCTAANAFAAMPPEAQAEAIYALNNACALIQLYKATAPGACSGPVAKADLLQQPEAFEAILQLRGSVAELVIQNPYNSSSALARRHLTDSEETLSQLLNTLD